MPAETGILADPAGTIPMSPETTDASRNISVSFPFGYQRFTLESADNPYVVKISLDRTVIPPVDGAFFRIRLEFAQSTRPAVEIYDDTEAGTLLQGGINGTNTFQTAYVFEAVFENGVWNKYDVRAVPSVPIATSMN